MSIEGLIVPTGPNVYNQVIYGSNGTGMNYFFRDNTLIQTFPFTGDDFMRYWRERYSQTPKHMFENRKFVLMRPNHGDGIVFEIDGKGGHYFWVQPKKELT